MSSLCREGWFYWQQHLTAGIELLLMVLHNERDSKNNPDADNRGTDSNGVRSKTAAFITIDLL